MSQPRLLLTLPIASLLACPGDPVVDPSTTDADTEPGTSTGGVGTATGEPSTDAPTGSTATPTATTTTGESSSSSESSTSTGADTTGAATSTADDTTGSSNETTGSTGSTGDDTTGSTGEPGPLCGDGHLDDGEACDNGPANGDDQACTADCAINVCGDGKQGPGEACDDGNVLDGDACTSVCSPPGCGDGLPAPGEACDDGDDDDTDGCTAACTLPVCGDGFVQPVNGETCDDGAMNGDDQACTSDCSINVCGDGLVGPDEPCDDGNLVDGDGCSAVCEPPPAATALQLEFSPIKQFEFSWPAAAGATHYQLLESHDGLAPYAQLGADIVGLATARTMPLHLRFGARYVLRACNGEGCADSAPVTVVDAMVDAIGYFKASNTGAGDAFGTIDLELSGDGSTLVIGAHQEDSAATGVDGVQADDTAANAGSVYVFVRQAGVWSQQAYLKASNTDAGDLFGYSLALSADGDTLAVGAYAEDSAATGVDGDQADDTAANAGAVYLFERAGEVWAQQAFIKASNTAAGDQFGASVALSGDGDTLAVGASTEDSAAIGIGGDQADNAAASAGAVYVFARAGQTWSQQAYVKPSNTGAGDQFGLRVALSGDGSTLAVGSPTEDSAGSDPTDNTSTSAGAAYMFVRTGDVWAQQAILKPVVVGAGDQFGGDVVLSADGDTLAVAARFEDSNATGVDGDPTNNTAVDAGAAYVFRRQGPQWTQAAFLKPTNTGAGDLFGAPLVLSADGATLAVGANQEDSAALGLGGDAFDDTALSAGAVHVYTRVDQTWSQRAYVKASNSDLGDFFGAGVGLSGDGRTLAVGAYAEDGPATGIGGDPHLDALAGAGAVYVY